jgi:hypothetical protein
MPLNLIILFIFLLTSLYPNLSLHSINGRTTLTQQYKKIPQIEFCQFPLYLGVKVRTTFVYSGVEEYWSIDGANNCKEKISVEFDYSDVSLLSSLRFQRNANRLHNNYWKYRMVVEAIGVFDIDSVNGYGHLNSNKAVFKTEKVIRSSLKTSRSTPKNGLQQGLR